MKKPEEVSADYLILMECLKVLIFLADISAVRIKLHGMSDGGAVMCCNEAAAVAMAVKVTGSLIPPRGVFVHSMLNSLHYVAVYREAVNSNL